MTTGVTTGAILSSVRSQETAVQVLRSAVAGNSVHHAYLFEGPSGVGKELAALGLAQALVCENRKPGASDACGPGTACLRPHASSPRRRPRRVTESRNSLSIPGRGDLACDLGAHLGPSG